VDARLRRDCDLPLGQFMPMRVIAGTPGCRVLDVSVQLQMTVGAASKVALPYGADSVRRHAQQGACRALSVRCGPRREA
jgi:hypothetical protein